MRCCRSYFGNFGRSVSGSGGVGVDFPHAPLSVAGTSSSYNANSSLLSDGSRSYSYDGANRLAMVTLANGTVSYAYGPDGDHIQTLSLIGTSTGTTTTWLGDTVITNTGTYIKSPHPDVRKLGGATCYVHCDHLGSIRVETDASQASMLRLRTATFGSRILTYQGANYTDEDRAFIGERVDTDVDLMDLNARWYNPATALFLTADDLDPIDTAQARAGSPIGWLANPVGTNRYAYAGQDPVNKRDPGGHAIDRSADTAKALAMLNGAVVKTSGQRAMPGKEASGNSAGILSEHSDRTAAPCMRIGSDRIDPLEMLLEGGVPLCWDGDGSVARRGETHSAVLMKRLNQRRWRVSSNHSQTCRKSGINSKSGLPRDPAILDCTRITTEEP